MIGKNQKIINLLIKPAIVYMAVNLVNGKKYIGITSQRLEQRKSAHIRGWGGRGKPSLLHQAIKKYGIENISFSVLKNCDSYQEALDMERMFIKKWKPEYNLTKGGEGILGFKMPKSVLQKRGERPSPLRGILRSPETIEKMRKGNMGRVLNLTEEQRDLRRKQAERMRKIKAKNPKPNSEKQREWASLLGKTKRKSIICTNDGRIFESAKSADNFYNLHRGAASAFTKGRGNRKKLCFEYVEEK